MQSLLRRTRVDMTCLMPTDGPDLEIERAYQEQQGLPPRPRHMADIRCCSHGRGNPGDDLHALRMDSFGQSRRKDPVPPAGLARPGTDRSVV